MLETIPHSSGYEIGYTSIYGMNKNFRHVSNVSYHRVLLVAPCGLPFYREHTYIAPNRSLHSPLDNLGDGIASTVVTSN